MRDDDVYKGKEIDTILRAAARLQEEDEARNDGGLGLSLKEVEEIAAESGIDPRFVRQAALITSSDEDDDGKFYFWGGPISVRRNFIINRSLTRQEMEDLVPSFQRIKDNAGQTDSLNTSLTWSSQSRKNQSSTTVIMQVEGDKTVCSLKSPVMMPGFLVHYVPMILGIMIGLPFAATAGFTSTTLVIAAILLSTLFLVTRFTYGKLADKKQRDLKLIEEAIKSVGRSTAESEIPTREHSAQAFAGSTAESKKIDLDNLADEIGNETRARESRGTRRRE